MIIHWRHQISQRSKDRRDGISPIQINELKSDNEETLEWTPLTTQSTDETDNRIYYAQPRHNPYSTYTRYLRVDDDDDDGLNDRMYNRFEPPPVYPKLFPRPSNSPNEDFIYVNRHSQYDNLSTSYQPNYKTNYLKNSDLI